MIWYILHCPDDNTAEWIRFCKENISRDILKDAFAFSYERMKRYQGAWHLEWADVFPECIFLETENADALLRELEKNEALSQILRETDGFQAIEENIQDLLQELFGRSHRISMSRGVIRKGIPIVMQGPLKGKEHWITRIDRHKRLAFLRMAPGAAPVKAGLEITEKTV